MNKKEILKDTIIKAVVARQMTNKSAANRLNLSVRQIQNLKGRYKQGDTSMLHRNCGRQPSKTHSPEFRQRILDIRGLPEFEKANTKHFMEILADKYGIKVGYTFLTQLFAQAGIRSPKEHRRHKKAHPRRERKAHEGELIQTDATPFAFFKDDPKLYTLHGMIDDATGKVTGLYMCVNECTHGYFEVTKQTLSGFGTPEAIYADGSSIFFSRGEEEISLEDELRGVTVKPTQYGRIMDTLGVKLIHARSSQAKGRVERLWETLQSRLPVEFIVNGITSIDEANEFLKTYIDTFNRQFSIPPAGSQSYFVPVTRGVDMDVLFSVIYVRSLDAGACFSLNNVIFRAEGISCPRNTKVEILINKKTGVIARFKERLYKVTPIIDKSKRPVNSTESVSMIINQFVYYHCLKNERIA
jgi:transposase